jgi:hypothetical protein
MPGEDAPMKHALQKSFLVALVALGLGVSLGGCTTYDDGYGHRHHGWWGHRHYDSPRPR